jgi:hypothetical protein
MTQNKIRLLALALLSVLWISACSKTDSNPASPNNSGSLLPLALGNQWIMQTYTYDFASGGMKASSIDTVKFIKDTLIQNEKWYTSGDGAYTTNRTTGVWQYNAADGMRLYFKYPAQVNDSYMIINGDGVKGYDTMTVKVLSLDQSVTVQAGTFSCITYQWSVPANKGTITYQFAPGKGLVLMQSEGPNPFNNQTITFMKSELMSYTLK